MAAPKAGRCFFGGAFRRNRNPQGVRRGERSRISPPPGAACSSLVVPERTRRTKRSLRSKHGLGNAIQSSRSIRDSAIAENNAELLDFTRKSFPRGATVRRPTLFLNRAISSQGSVYARFHIHRQHGILFVTSLESASGSGAFQLSGAFIYTAGSCRPISR